MTHLVKQRTPHDCAVACMAMLTGRTYDSVMAAIGDAFDPEKGMAREETALKRLGFDNSYASGEPAGNFVCLRRDWCISTKFFRRLAWARRALMSVPSLNFEGGWHMVYFDGREVYDPSNMKTYSRFEQLEPDEMVLFSEVRPKPVLPVAHAEKTREYAERLIEPLREVARVHGYALGVHGTLERDIDLIAAPWAKPLSPARVLADAIQAKAEEIIGFAYLKDAEGSANPSYHENGSPGYKPHGRLVWSFHLGGGPYIDLSILAPGYEPDIHDYVLGCNVLAYSG